MLNANELDSDNDYDKIYEFSRRVENRARPGSTERSVCDSGIK